MTKTYKQPEEIMVDDPVMNQPVFLSDSVGMYETVTAVPTGKPTNAINQIKVYTNSTTYRLYWYDVKNNVWHYVTATA